jgi:hypothetical protein
MLSFSKDKLVAISGLAKAFLKQFNTHQPHTVECRYLAGLWSIELEHQLLWYQQQAQPKNFQLRAPSWSWASVNGIILFQLPHTYDWAKSHCLIHVMEVSLGYCSSNEFGEVDGGSLKVKCGPLYSVQIECSQGNDSRLELNWLDRELSRLATGTTYIWTFPLTCWALQLRSPF